MEIPDTKIIEFIRNHHVPNLATSISDKPWCANCFYTSDEDTRHMQEAMVNAQVTSSIVLETEIIGKIQGIQFEGMLIKSSETLKNKLKIAYLKRFPYDIVSTSPIWGLVLSHIKFTDNRLGFGKKLIWKKELNEQI